MSVSMSVKNFSGAKIARAITKSTEA